MQKFRRKYKFNALDHIYYMGRDTWRLPLRWWPTPLQAVVIAVFVTPMTFLAAFIEGVAGTALFVAALAVFIGFEWPLERYRFTPERERAYFRRYPERKRYRPWLLFLTGATTFIASMMFWGFVFLRLMGRGR